MAKARKPDKKKKRPHLRRPREILTPEGVRLSVDLADRGERAAAVFLDLMILFGGVLLCAIFFATIGRELPDGWGTAISLILFFFVRNFYFIFFELRWHGRTPGKRLLKLKVIDRHGGRLGTDAIAARNIVREVELFIPATLLIFGGSFGVEPLGILFALVWTSVFTFMPFFNKDCLRAGDIIAGTWVISVPQSVLLPDLIEKGKEETDIQVPYPFTDAQLDIYGIFELQTLEDVLRRPGADAAKVHGEVSDRIRRKIGYDSEVDPRPFLEAFYAALRSRLEARMLLGVRREDKHDRG